MFFLEYENDTKIVSKIHESFPSLIQDNHSIATSDSFDVGMELEFIITVDTVNESGKVTGTSTTRQVAPAYQLLQKIDELQNENESLKNSQADQDEIIMNLVLGGM